MSFKILTHFFLEKRKKFYPDIKIQISHEIPLWVYIHDQMHAKLIYIQDKDIIELGHLREKAIKQKALSFEFYSLQNDDFKEFENYHHQILDQLHHIKVSIQSIQNETIEGQWNQHVKKNAVTFLVTKLQNLYEQLKHFEIDSFKSNINHHESIDPLDDDDSLYQKEKLMDSMQMENRWIQERTNDIIYIQNECEQLAMMMREFSILVIDQGTIIDRIDYNVEQTKEYISEGLVQLQKAEYYQKKSNLNICIILLFVLIVFLICILFFKKLLT